MTKEEYFKKVSEFESLHNQIGSPYVCIDVKDIIGEDNCSDAELSWTADHESPARLLLYFWSSYSLVSPTVKLRSCSHIFLNECYCEEMLSRLDNLLSRLDDVMKAKK